MHYNINYIEKTIDEVINIDITYISSNKENPKILTQIKDYYLIKNYDLLLEIVKNVFLLDHRELSRLKENMSNNISFLNINYSPYTYIKSNNDFIVYIISIIIYRSLNDLKTLSENTLFDENELFLKNSKSSKTSHSDKIINSCIYSLESFQIWIEIKKQDKIHFSDKIRLILWFIIENVCKTGLIKRIKISVNNKESIFLIVEHNKIPSNFFILSLIPHKIYKRTEKIWYLYSYHYSNITKIFKENQLSGETVIFENEEIELMNNLCNNWVYIDKNILKSIFNDLCVYEKIDPIQINESHMLLINNIKNAIKNNDTKLTSDLSSKLSILLNIQRIKKILEMDIDNEKIYLPFSFDFRARLYFLSIISPTSYKEFRYCIHWGEYKNTQTKPHIMNALIENELDLYTYKLDEIRYIDEKTLSSSCFYFKNKEKNIKRAILWILIAIAETKKNIKKTIHIEEFIDMGIQIIAEKDLCVFKFEHRIKIKYYINLLKEIEKDIYIKRPLSKDATASVFQHLVKSLGAKTEEALKICNLSSTNRWYDTYKHLIDNFSLSISLINISIKEYDLIFSRDNLKKIIMIYNYGAGKKKCVSEFYSQISKNSSIEEIIKTPDKAEEIKKIIYKFYKYLTENNSIYQWNIDIINSMIYRKEFILKIENVNVNYKYNHMATKQVELIHNKERYIRQERYLTANIDHKKIERSAKANYIQSLDAALVRWYLRENYGITIHDCFIVDYLNTTYLVSKTNEGMRLVFHDLGIEKKINTDNLFSIFIIL